MKISSVFSLIHCVELKIAWFYREVASCVMANPLHDYKFLKKKVKVTKRVENVQRARSNKNAAFLQTLYFLFKLRRAWVIN